MLKKSNDLYFGMEGVVNNARLSLNTRDLAKKKVLIILWYGGHESDPYNPDSRHMAHLCF